MSLGVRIRPANSKRVAHICLFCRPIQEKISAGVDNKRIEEVIYAVNEECKIGKAVLVPRMISGSLVFFEFRGGYITYGTVYAKNNG